MVDFDVHFPEVAIVSVRTQIWEISEKYGTGQHESIEINTLWKQQMCNTSCINQNSRHNKSFCHRKAAEKYIYLQTKCKIQTKNSRSWSSLNSSQPAKFKVQELAKKYRMIRELMKSNTVKISTDWKKLFVEKCQDFYMCVSNYCTTTLCNSQPRW